MWSEEPLFAVGRPDWWDSLQGYDFIQGLHGCPQDPVHHAEGDVWIHTGMVCKEAQALRTGLSEEAGLLMAVASALHDIAKPQCTKQEEDGRITSRGHSRRGEVMARRLLWEMGVPFRLREEIVGFVRYHQIPFFLIDSRDPLYTLCEVSTVVRPDLLARVAEADIRGRFCADPDRVLTNIALFLEFAREHGCESSAYRFPTDHSRFLYFRKPTRHPTLAAYDDTRCDVTVLSGLPGAGKDTWVKRQAGDLPVVSLDALREAMDVDPEDNQGGVVHAAYDQAKEYLRKRQSFIWNATNLSRQMRGQVVSLMAGYGARVRIVYVEAPCDRLFVQNRERENRIPQAAIEKLLGRWEVPDRTEAHTVEYHTGE